MPVLLACHSCAGIAAQRPRGTHLHCGCASARRRAPPRCACSTFARSRCRPSCHPNDRSDRRCACCLRQAMGSRPARYAPVLLAPTRLERPCRLCDTPQRRAETVHAGGPAPAVHHCGARQGVLRPARLRRLALQRSLGHRRWSRCSPNASRCPVLPWIAHTRGARWNPVGGIGQPGSSSHPMLAKGHDLPN